MKVLNPSKITARLRRQSVAFLNTYSSDCRASVTPQCKAVVQGLATAMRTMPNTSKASVYAVRSQSRTYTTLEFTHHPSTTEDYDLYALHGTPSETTQCDLGAIIDVAGEMEVLDSNDYSSVQGFDVVQPAWNRLESSEGEDWIFNKQDEKHDTEFYTDQFRASVSVKRKE